MEMQHRFGEGYRVNVLQRIAWARIDVQGDNPQEPLVVIPAVLLRRRLSLPIRSEKSYSG